MTHQTEDGKIIIIALMDDIHLKNTVRLHLKKIKEAKSMLSSKSEIKIQETLYGIKNSAIEKKMIQQINQSRQALPIYIMECMIRGIDFKEELNKAFDRSLIKEKEKILTLFQQEIDKDPKITTSHQTKKEDPRFPITGYVSTETYYIVNQ